ncbi:putative aminohydrolase SsnA [Candidatus Bipolaricaulota bacterium]|nr:putative aminohydrolase SsnA [Candidatus Bipolaricaulota bacterium]
MNYLLDGGTIWTNNGKLIENGRVLVENGKIVKVGGSEEIGNLSEDKGETIDCSQKLVMPGLVNAHTHLYSTLARGLVLPDYSPENLSELLTGLWWKLDRKLNREATRISARVGAVELLKNGVTTVFDHHSSPNYTEGSLQLIEEEVVEKIGLRSSLCYEVTDRNGEAEAQQGIRENLDWLSTVSNRDDDLTAGQFGLHASFTLSSGTLEEVSSYLEDLDTGIHIHLAEGREDQDDSLNQYGNRVVTRLDNHGLIDEHAILAHGIHLSEPEKDLLGDRDPFLVHNPRSNMNNGAGVADVEGLLDRGLSLGLGTDGLGFSMIDEFRSTLLLQKIYHGSPSIMGLEDVGRMLFEENYELAEDAFGIKLGKLSPGYRADITVIDYPSPTPITEDNFLGHLFFGTSGSNYEVETVFVDGEPVLRDSELVNLDKPDVYREARKISEHLWEKIRGK